MLFHAFRGLRKRRPGPLAAGRLQRGRRDAHHRRLRAEQLEDRRLLDGDSGIWYVDLDAAGTAEFDMGVYEFTLTPPPLIDPIPDAASLEGSLFEYTARSPIRTRIPGPRRSTTADGADTLPLAVDQDAKTFDLAHHYADDGVYTATVRVQDDDGGFDTRTFTVSVSNVVPTLDPLPDLSIDEGEFITPPAGHVQRPGVRQLLVYRNTGVA